MLHYFFVDPINILKKLKIAPENVIKHIHLEEIRSGSLLV